MSCFSFFSKATPTCIKQGTPLGANRLTFDEKYTIIISLEIRNLKVNL